jgi:hypothetical protein
VSFAFNFLGSVLVLFFNMLFSLSYEEKIVLTGDACSKPPITIRFHDFHAGDITEVSERG